MTSASDRFLIATFYQFFDLENPQEFRDWLQQRGLSAGVKGTVLLAEEGINGTLSGSAEDLRTLLAELRQRTRIELPNCKFSEATVNPFRRFRVRVKPELVTFRQTEADPRQRSGTYISPANWNRILQEEQGLRLIDTRNTYETAIGKFRGAEDPRTDNFTDFSEYVEKHLDPAQDRAIAMYCTGGIRCEKASSYLLAKGFEKVYHLEGGILRYLEEVDASESTFEGECYVFDERVSVDQHLKPGSFRNCSECGWPAARGLECPECGAADPP